MAREEPTLFEQTMELGKALKTISDRDPDGTPGDAASTAFTHWLEVIGDRNREPRYFRDVAENFDIQANSNKDLLTIFEMLHPYVEIPDDEIYEEAPPPPRKLIGLPMA